MSQVMDSLLEIIQTDPLPEGYTSSYWQEFGRQTVVERRQGALMMEGVQFGAVYARNPLIHLMHQAERFSYRSLTQSLDSYPVMWRAAKRLARELSFALTFDVWKPAVILSILWDHWMTYDVMPRTVMVIGDGYGFLGALIHRQWPSARIYCVDLPKTLAFQVRTHETADPAATKSLLTDTRGPISEIMFVCPQHVEQVTDSIDCAINIASMQEMNYETIAHYFRALRRRSTPRSRFYCVNRLDKQLPGGERIQFHQYPWDANDEVFLDGPCPFYTHFLSLRSPFVNHFDGVHQHRLVRLAPES